MTRKMVFASLVVASFAIGGISSAFAEGFAHRDGVGSAVVYVTDFGLTPGSIQSETRSAALPLHAYLEEAKARSLVDMMSSAIVEDLAEKGITAIRLAANAPLPRQGWLVRGIFTKVDEGNRVRRAVIGFGAGQTDLQVAVATVDLSAGMAASPIYRAQIDATSNKRPGAIILPNPYVAAAKFVLAGRDLDRSTRATAQRIADDIAVRLIPVPRGD